MHMTTFGIIKSYKLSWVFKGLCVVWRILTYFLLKVLGGDCLIDFKILIKIKLFTREAPAFLHKVSAHIDDSGEVPNFKENYFGIPKQGTRNQTEFDSSM